MQVVPHARRPDQRLRAEVVVRALAAEHRLELAALGHEGLGHLGMAAIHRQLQQLARLVQQRVGVAGGGEEVAALRRAQEHRVGVHAQVGAAAEQPPGLGLDHLLRAVAGRGAIALEQVPVGRLRVAVDHVVVADQLVPPTGERFVEERQVVLRHDHHHRDLLAGCARPASRAAGARAPRRRGRTCRRRRSQPRRALPRPSTAARMRLTASATVTGGTLTSGRPPSRQRPMAAAKASVTAGMSRVGATQPP